MESFDYLFYLNLYPDLREANINTEYEARQHYMNHGKKEGRICNAYALECNVEKGMNAVAKDYNKLVITKEREEKINILIRTSNRPESFEKCINSVLGQQYTNYEIIICYDDPRSLDYLDKLRSNSKVTYFSVFENSNEKYKFNLYCNTLMNRVTDGWIMFLDDDDMFCHDKVLKMINEHLLEQNIVYVWKFLRPDKIIYPEDVNNVHLGEIASCAFIFHSCHKLKSKWPGKQCGDFYFFKSLTKMLFIVFIDTILTRTSSAKMIGNFGK